ncbi:MAG: diacylglycerol kinase [Victivallales bacterium]|nr:diacylglycerol kinase [Victivallales bacterium]
MRPAIIPKSKGIKHIFDAFGYSWNGLKVAIKETAFSMECICGVIVLAMACLFYFLDWFSMPKAAVLVAAWLLVMATELLNTAIEAIVDLVSPDYNELAKHAKDLGSAAVAVVVTANCVLWFFFLLDAFIKVFDCTGKC